MRRRLAQDNWGGQTSNQWSDASNWDSGLPGSTSDVVITNATYNPVVYISGISPTIANLTVGGSNSLVVDGGQMLTLAGSGGSAISNSGSIQLNGGGGTNTYLTLDSNTTLQGGGTLTLNVASGNGSTFIQQGASGVTLTNVDNTIQGAGVIGNGGLSFVNQASGTVNANSAGQALTFNGGAITNAGLFEATSGGSLQIAGITVSNGGGILTAGSGSYVQLSGSTDIQGGTLNNNGGWLGTVSGNTAYLDGTTNGVSPSTETTPAT